MKILMMATVVCCFLLNPVSLFPQQSQYLNASQLTVDSREKADKTDPNSVKQADEFEKRWHPFQNLILPYRLFIPATANSDYRYPLVLALHGAGERGTDNQIQLTANRLAFSWSDSASQADRPCFIVAPQCPANHSWVETFGYDGGSYNFSSTPISLPLAAVVDLLDSLVQAYAIDTTRIYVTGLSMGGFATWDLIMRYPRRFAAAVPMCGAGDPSQVGNLMKIPIWDFHGDQDYTVPVAGSRNMIAAFEVAGRKAVYTHCFEGDCNESPDSVMDSAVANGSGLLYTEYSGAGHQIWNQSYDLPQLHQWMFAQSLSQSPAAVITEPRFTSDAFLLSQNYPNPFNPSTVISYQITVNSFVTLRVYDVLGREVVTLVDERQSAGYHTVKFNASNLPSGVYLYHLQDGTFSAMKKMLLIK